MKIELLEVRKSEVSNNNFMEFTLDNGSSKFQWFDFTDLDGIESIELQLTEIVQKLSEYRKQQKDKK